MAARTTQARGDNAACYEGNPGRPVYRLDEYEMRKHALKASLEKWGICLLAPMRNADGDQVDALGVAGVDGGTDLVVALRMLSERYKCNRMEVLERFFPEITDHLLNDRLSTVVTSLTNFKVLVTTNQRGLSLYGPLYDGLAIGALARPKWMAGFWDNPEDSEDLGGAALAFRYFRWQGFPCGEESWRRAFLEEPWPRSRQLKVQRSWPTALEPRKGFTSKQKRWIVTNLRSCGMALLEVLQKAMGRLAREKPVDFLSQEVRKTLLSIYPYDAALLLIWGE